jgi:hypothetical protein
MDANPSGRAAKNIRRDLNLAHARLLPPVQNPASFIAVARQFGGHWVPAQPKMHLAPLRPCSARVADKIAACYKRCFEQTE